MCIRIHIRYVRSSLAVVVFFLIKSQSKRSPGTNFAAEDMKKSERYSFIAAMFESNRIARKRSNIRNFENESNIHPIRHTLRHTVQYNIPSIITSCLN